VDDLDAAFREAGIPPARFCWVSSSYTALRLATGHGCLGVLPADTAGPDLRAGVLVQVRLGPVRPLVAGRGGGLPAARRRR
jgi:DNA-binding transcriptional LysR family regulator